MIQFDHIEIHVKDAENYAAFLTVLMGNGRYKKISDNNTYMFVSADNVHFEIKQKEDFINTLDLKTGVGFCLPCLRMKGAKEHLLSISQVEITHQVENPDGPCYFFKDYEGIMWHCKDYERQDIFINI